VDAGEPRLPLRKLDDAGTQQLSEILRALR
jgi:hypothetical protein